METSKIILIGLIFLLFIILGLGIFAVSINKIQGDCYDDLANENCEKKGLVFYEFEYDGSNTYHCSNPQKVNEIEVFLFNEEEINKCIGGKEWIGKQI